MKERDYINATNLAKLRIAADCVRDCLPDGRLITKEELQNALVVLDVLARNLEGEIGA